MNSCFSPAFRLFSEHLAIFQIGARPCRCWPKCCLAFARDSYEFTATDLEVELVASTEVAVQQAGDIMLDFWYSL